MCHSGNIKGKMSQHHHSSTIQMTQGWIKSFGQLTDVWCSINITFVDLVYMVLYLAYLKMCLSVMYCSAHYQSNVVRWLT